MKKNLLAVLFGFLIVGLMLSGLEIYFRLFVPPKELSFGFDPIPYVQSSESTLSPEMMQEIRQDPIASWDNIRPIEGAERFFFEGLDYSQKGLASFSLLNTQFAKPGSFRSRVYSRGGELLYDVKFTFDDRGRRITPIVPGAQKNILAFGDSYTLGEGVNDEQSFPYVLGTYRPSTQVFNFGIGGGSPNETLYEVTKIPDYRLPDLGNQEVTVLYTFMSDHMERLFCRSGCLTALENWKLAKPFYTLRDGKPYLEGTFFDRKALNLFYEWFNKSAVVQATGMVLPPRFTQAHFDFFATVMVEIRDTLKVKYPKLKFYVVMYPGNSHPYANDLTSACRNRGLNVLNYANVDTHVLSQGREKIAGDGHPSPITQMIFARLLNRDLPH